MNHASSGRTARTSVRPSTTGLRRVLAVGAVALGALVAATGPASAHDTVVGTSPTDGAQLTEAPARAEVELSDVPQSIAPRIVVTDEAGTALVDAEPTIDGRVAGVDLPALDNGTYQVAWRVVSSDGHPIQGVYTFTVDDPAAAAPTDATDPATDETATATTTTTDETTEPAADATTTAADSDDSGSSWLPATSIAIVVVIAILALVVLLRRRTSLKDQS